MDEYASGIGLGTVMPFWRTGQAHALASPVLATWYIHQKKEPVGRESAPVLVSKVVEREIASGKGGTEGIDSATDGQTLLASGLRPARGNKVIKRSKARSTHEVCWEAG